MSLLEDMRAHPAPAGSYHFLQPAPAARTLPALQFVTADGELTETGREHGVDVHLACSLFRDMTLARALDREALALQRQGELSLWLQSWGQEAAQVGSIRALRDSDQVFPSYRDHAAALCRGITPSELLAQWRGVTHAGWAPERCYHFNSLVLGTQTLHATGYAMGDKLIGGESVVLTYFGEGAASQGDVNEALNWAAAHILPVVFFCQNNQWAISTPATVQSGSPLYQRATGFGLRSWNVDGNDVLAVHAVTRAAAESARRGDGPVFIEAQTFRMAGHSTSDDPKKYRADAEVEIWAARDPLRRLELLLRNLGVDRQFFEDVDDAGRELATETRAACKELAAPEMCDLFEHVYADVPAALIAEQNDYLELIAELQVFAGEAR